FNNDHIADLAFFGSDSGRYPLFVLASLADGTYRTFEAASPLAQDGKPCLAAGDFDRDGRTDLVVVNQAGIYLLQGNGDGTFQFGRTVGHIGVSLQSAAAADMNNDGVLDLVIAGDNAVEIHLG